MRIVSYDFEDERDYGFLILGNSVIPRDFLESALGMTLPRDVRDLLPDRELVELIESVINKVPVESTSLEELHLGPPIPNPGKIICLGLNYLDHALEAGMEPPEGMPIFMKPATALTGPFDPIIKPRHVEKLDYEIELAIVIGSRCRDIEPKEAYENIFGYMILNDVSARDIQFRDGQWTRGKIMDTFAPTGPCLVSKEEVGAPHNLRMLTTVNGEVRQSSSTSNMIRKIPEIVSILSQGVTLEPGDIIATGTPAGVGVFQKPEPKLLQPGDVVEMWIENIGTIRNHVITIE
ncbi:MAG: fumarylacetoacetate hydrolase family protein [Aigarchaeota archaeon]|nr:fumarylacetoacetate hydrolase family protein [Candidatus Wolframiiraptor gerlachensis]